MSTTSATPAAHKVVMVGESGVGKTSIVKRLCHDSFEEGICPTVGAGYVPHSVSLRSGIVKLNVWDTAGQERFSTLVPLYLQHAESVLLVFDASQPPDPTSVTTARDTIFESIHDDVPLFLVANKMDLASESFSDVTFSVWAEQHRATFHKTSAKTGVGIEALFALVAQAIITASDGNKKSDTLLREIYAPDKPTCC
jgi:small GTP-binding protein